MLNDLFCKNNKVIYIKKTHTTTLGQNVAILWGNSCMPSAMRVLFVELHLTFTLLKTAMHNSLSHIGTFFSVIGGTPPHTMEKVGILTE